MAISFDTALAALTSSHDHLAAAVSPLTAEQVVAPAYPSEWSIAQVMSHLGSGAEIFSLYLTSGLNGSPAPGRDDFVAVWDVWNAKSPQQQAAHSLVSDAAFLAQVRATSPEQRLDVRVQMFNGEQDLVGILRMRLGEHTVHTWDVLVALDPTATLAADATDLLLDGLAGTVGFSAKPSPADLTIGVRTADPERDLTLQLGSDGAKLTEGVPAGAAATLRIPAEALIRLVYGRLDPDHTPAGVEADGVEVADLRQVFPGF